jgi:hypothetical protein
MIKHHDQKHLTKGKVYFVFHLEVHNPGKSQDRNVEAGADAEAVWKHCLLACSLWLAQPAFFKTTYPGMALPTVG